MPDFVLDPTTKRLYPPLRGVDGQIVSVSTEALAAAGIGPGLRYLNDDGSVRLEPDPQRVADANDIAALRAYLGVVAPTAAQTVGAAKALIRILRDTLGN